MKPAEDRPTPCDLLIRNGLVVTMNAAREVLHAGAVAIADGQIHAVGRDADVTSWCTAERSIDARGCVVHPGFIDSHVHPTQHIIRFAFPENFRYEDTLGFYIDFILALTVEDEHAASALACLEMALHGTTTFLEGCGSVLEPDAAAAAVDEVGIRALLGDPYVWDVGGAWSEPLKRRVATDRRRALRILGGQLTRARDSRSRVRGHIALTGHATASTELLLTAKAYAEEHGVILNMHQSYAASDTADDDRLRGEHPLRHFERVGALSNSCTFAHMNVIREDELEPIVHSGMSVVWCPSASMMWGCGGTTSGPHLALLRRGVPIALGSDASNFSGTLDVADQGLLALLTARERTMQADALLAADVLTMCTVNGAQAVGMAREIGSIEVGKLADIVIRRGDLPEAEPDLDPIRHLVLAARSRSVDTVIVGGEVIVERGHSTRVDEERIRARARAAARQLLARMGRGVPQPRDDQALAP
jgi:5-methylthioadenosine/S-adenosylhomocysteine deaminase